VENTAGLLPPHPDFQSSGGDISTARQLAVNLTDYSIGAGFFQRAIHEAR
jgi:hypothetical protein